MVRELDGVEGFLTPWIVTCTESPAAIAAPGFREQVIVSPDGGLQVPMPLVPVVVSLTKEANTEPRPVPGGNTKVIMLELDSPPLIEVVNVTTYLVCARAAADGEEFFTEGLLTDDEETERAGPASSISSAPRADTAAIQRQRPAPPRPRRVSVAFTSPVLLPSGPQHPPDSCL